MRKLSYTLLALVALNGAYSHAKVVKPKNVLFILVDDLQKSSIHAYGNSQVETPHIDGIVNNGVSFMRTYTNGSLGGALSMPSRAMIMTGRGVFEVSRDGQQIPEPHTTLPEQLRSEGYETFATGKWHSDKASFNRSFSTGDHIFFGGMHPYNQNGHWEPRLYHYDPTAQYKEVYVGDKFSSELFADAAIAFLNGRKKNEKPFFAFVAFTSPHDPRNQHPDYGPKYDPSTLDLPVNYLPQHPFDNGEMSVRDEVFLPLPRTEEMVKQELAHYYGMVSEVDVQIGRILETLKARGELENTILVFASDNGLAVGQHGLLGKQNLYEHSIGVPLVIMASDLEKGVRKEQGCYLYDLYPTLCDLLGVMPSSSVTGKSLLPVLQGEATHRDRIFLTYNSVQRALVKDNWKYIIYNIEGAITEQLFDLKNDPWELVNLAENGAYKLKIAAYKRMLQEEMKRRNDFCNLDNHFWRGKPGKLSWDEGINLYVY
ncbi:MAG: sulfatase-like hydrolase/transferase [Phocaeicola sp.]